jgi:hypothetical protein
MAAYRDSLEAAATCTDLLDCARSVFAADLDSGHVTVLAEMIRAGHTVPGLGEQVALRLEPWRELTETVVRRVLTGTPLGRLLPPAEIAHGLVAAIFGLELLASLDGDHQPTLALLDRARPLARLLDGVGWITHRRTKKE